MIGLDDRAICSSALRRNRSLVEEVEELLSEDNDFSISVRENNETASNGLTGVVFRLGFVVCDAIELWR